MPDMKTLTINGVKYNIKDDTARTTLETKANLGSTNSFTGTNMFSQGVFMPVGMSAYWYQTDPSNRRAYINDTQYTGNAATATKATKDGAGNVIVDTYARITDIPTKVSELQNDEGYAAVGNVHTWEELQIFNQTMLLKETYQSEYVTTDGRNPTTTPTKSTISLTATGATTLNMSTIVADCLTENRTSTIFTAYITSTADYTLTITNAGTIKYIGSASDVAITSAGLLLNIMMLKDASGNVTSIVQASKLEGGA